VVLTANPSLAQAPPAATANPNPGNGPVRFVRSKTAGGFYPDPIYPADLMRRRVTGTVELIIRVDEGGRVASVDIAKSSGNSQLDRHAVQSVKDRWRFPAGQHPPYLWACEFRLPQ
jgi:TonB family protein